MSKVMIQLSQGGTEALMEVTPEELELLNEKKRKLKAKDSTWARRELDILGMVRTELQSKKQ